MPGVRAQLRLRAELPQVGHERVAACDVAAVDEERAPRGPAGRAEEIDPRQVLDERARQEEAERLFPVGSRREGGGHLGLDAQVELVQLRDLVDELRPRDPRTPEHQRVDLASLGRMREGQRRSEAEPEERYGPGPRAGAKLGHCQGNVVEPGAHEALCPLVTARIAGSEEIEAQAGETGCRQPLGEVAVHPIRPRLVGSDRPAEDDADGAPRAGLGRVIETEQRASLGAEMDRLLAPGRGSDLDRLHEPPSHHGSREGGRPLRENSHSGARRSSAVRHI